jgi:hypothetical protein
MNAQQLLERYANGTRDFSGADLRGVDLSHASLVGINLYRADLTDATLEQADLREANFLKADLTNANFTAANLSGANLRRAELTGTVLQSAILDSARFSDVVMPGGLPSARTRSSQTPLHRTPPSQDQRSISSRTQSHPHGGHSFQSSSPLPDLTPFHQATPPTLAELPVPSLALFWAGYSCFGGILGIYSAPNILWMMVWATALAWMLGESMAWFTPVVAAIAVMLSSGISIWAVILAVSVSLGLGLALVMLGWSWTKTLRDSLWIGGLVVILINLAQWLFRGDMTGIVVSGYFPLALLLIMGMGSTGIGAIAWLQMRADGFRRRQIAWVFAGCSALGLLCGGMIGKFLLPTG